MAISSSPGRASRRAWSCRSAWPPAPQRAAFLAPAGARRLRAAAVTAPVRAAPISVPLSAARGLPLSGSFSNAFSKTYFHSEGLLDDADGLL